MGNVHAAAPAGGYQDLPSYLVDMDAVTHVSTLGGGKLMKTMLCQKDKGKVVVKFYIKKDRKASLDAYVSFLKQLREKFSLNQQPSVVVFQRAAESERAIYLMRQYFAHNLRDWIHTHPFPTDLEKRWVAFQLLTAVTQMHGKGIRHGDLKCENVQLTSWNWAFVTDIAFYKPTYLPPDNPADYTLYFDAGHRRRCYLAPERFNSRIQEQKMNVQSDEGSGGVDGHVTEEMDIFSLGCVFAELFMDGEPLFDLSQLLTYREGKFDPWRKVVESKKLQDPHLRSLIAHMIQLDPSQRLPASVYLQHARGEGRIFPPYFLFLYKYFAQLLKPECADPDVKIHLIHTHASSFLKAVLGADAIRELREQVRAERCRTLQHHASMRDWWRAKSAQGKAGEARFSFDSSSIGLANRPGVGMELPGEEEGAEESKDGGDAQGAGVSAPDKSRPATCESCGNDCFSQVEGMSPYQLCLDAAFRYSMGGGASGEGMEMGGVLGPEVVHQAQQATAALDHLLHMSGLVVCPKPPGHRGACSTHNAPEKDGVGESEACVACIKMHVRDDDDPLANVHIRQDAKDGKGHTKLPKAKPGVSMRWLEVRNPFGEQSTASYKANVGRGRGAGLSIFLSVVCACMQNVRSVCSKLQALQLIASFGRFCDDAVRVGRLAAYCVAMIYDPSPQVKAQAVTSLVVVLKDVEHFAASDALLLTDYVFPSIQRLALDPEILPRVAYARAIPALAEAARRFLDLEYFHRHRRALESRVRGAEAHTRQAMHMKEKSFREDHGQRLAQMNGSLKQQPAGHEGPGSLSPSQSVRSATKAEGGTVPSSFDGPESLANDEQKTAVGNPTTGTVTGLDASGNADSDDEHTADLTAFFRQGTSGVLHTSASSASGEHKASYDDQLSSLRKLILSLVKDLLQSLEPRDAVVKRCLLADIGRLCRFLGRQLVVNELVPLLITVMNERSWQLRADFFAHITGLSVFVGREQFQSCVRPCLVEALNDVEEAVVLHALKSLTSLQRLGMFPAAVNKYTVGAVRAIRGMRRGGSTPRNATEQKKNAEDGEQGYPDLGEMGLHRDLLRKINARICEEWSALDVAHKVAPFLCHPSAVLRHQAVLFLEAVWGSVSLAQRVAFLVPMLSPFVEVGRLDARNYSRQGLVSACKPTMTRMEMSLVLHLLSRNSDTGEIKRALDVLAGKFEKWAEGVRTRSTAPPVPQSDEDSLVTTGTEQQQSVGSGADSVSYTSSCASSTTTAPAISGTTANTEAPDAKPSEPPSYFWRDPLYLSLVLEALRGRTGALRQYSMQGMNSQGSFRMGPQAHGYGSSVNFPAPAGVGDGNSAVGGGAGGGAGGDGPHGPSLDLAAFAQLGSKIPIYAVRVPPTLRRKHEKVQQTTDTLHKAGSYLGIGGGGGAVARQGMRAGSAAMGRDGPGALSRGMSERKLPLAEKDLGDRKRMGSVSAGSAGNLMPGAGGAGNAARLLAGARATGGAKGRGLVRQEADTLPRYIRDSLQLPEAPPELGDLRAEHMSRSIFYSSVKKLSGGGSVIEKQRGSTSSGASLARSARMGAGGMDPRHWRPRGVLVSTLTEHVGAVNCLSVFADNSFLASGGADGQVRLWACGRLKVRANPVSVGRYTPPPGMLGHQVGSRGRSGGIGRAPSALRQASDSPSLTPIRTAMELGGGGIRDLKALDRAKSLAVCSGLGTVSVVRVGAASSGEDGGTLARCTEVMKVDTAREGPPLCVDHFTSLTQSLLVYGTQRGVVHGWDLRAKRDAFRFSVHPSLSLFTKLALGPSQYSMCLGTALGYVSLYDVRYQLPVQMWRHGTAGRKGFGSDLPAHLAYDNCIFGGRGRVVGGSGAVTGSGTGEVNVPVLDAPRNSDSATARHEFWGGGDGVDSATLLPRDTCFGSITLLKPMDTLSVLPLTQTNHYRHPTKGRLLFIGSKSTGPPQLSGFDVVTGECRLSLRTFADYSESDFVQQQIEHLHKSHSSHLPKRRTRENKRPGTTPTGATTTGTTTSSAGEDNSFGGQSRDNGDGAHKTKGVQCSCTCHAARGQRVSRDRLPPRLQKPKLFSYLSRNLTAPSSADLATPDYLRSRWLVSGPGGTHCSGCGCALNSSSEPNPPAQHQHSVRGFLCCPSYFALTASSDQVVRFWDFRNPRASYRLCDDETLGGRLRGSASWAGGASGSNSGGSSQGPGVGDGMGGGGRGYTEGSSPIPAYRDRNVDNCVLLEEGVITRQRPGGLRARHRSQSQQDDDRTENSQGGGLDNLAQHRHSSGGFVLGERLEEQEKRDAAKRGILLDTGFRRGPGLPSVAHADEILALEAIEFPQQMLATAGRDGVVRVWV